VNPEPLHIRYAMDELMLDLRHNLHGQNAPLTAQAVLALVHTLPRDLCANLASREFRNAVRAYFAEQGLYFDPTRSDIAHGAVFLKRRGLLPYWVHSENIGEL
jgi:hypothetical protein